MEDNGGRVPRGRVRSGDEPLADRPLGGCPAPAGARAGLVQLLCVLAGLGLGPLLPRITTDATVASARVTTC